MPDVGNAASGLDVGPRAACAVATIALCISGCVEWPLVYRGTGSLLTSGSPTEVAPHSATLAVCVENTVIEEGGRENGPLQLTHALDSPAEPPARYFTILAIGDDCAIEGVWVKQMFRAGPGPLCTLHFSDGERTLQVTDVTARFGQWGKFVDTGYFEIQVAGDDARSGKHAVYHFSGTELVGADRRDRCKERGRHNGAVHAADS